MNIAQVTFVGSLAVLTGTSAQDSVSALHPLIEVPLGAKVVMLPGVVICSTEPSDWTLVKGANTLLSPASPSAIGSTTVAMMAASSEACAGHAWAQALIVTSSWPVFDPTGTVAWVDEGRLDVRGSNLRGVTVNWQQGTRTGSDVCLEPREEGKLERCSLALGKGLLADPSRLSLTWVPAGAEQVPGARFFNAAGQVAGPDAFQLRVAKVAIRSPLSDSASVDLFDGGGRASLTHSEAVAAVDCGAIRCELADGSLLVHPGAQLVASVIVRLRLIPKVFIVKADALEPTTTVPLSITRCPMSFASGEPLRYADGARIVMRIGDRCEKDASRLRWFANGNLVDVVRVEKDEGDSFVVLRVGRLESERLTVTAARDDPDRSAIASTSIDTKAAPEPVVTLELPGHGPIDFVPKNREALVHIVGDAEHLALLPVNGIYKARRDSSGTHIQGEAMAGGMVSLRFAYLAKGLPDALGDVNLAVLTEAVSRAIREASVPVDFSAKAAGNAPFLELLCQKNGTLIHVEQGKKEQIPFGDRDSCRLIIHQERLKAEDGTQNVTVEAEIDKPEGDARSGGRVSEHMGLRTASSSRTMWFHGIQRPFDRLEVRVAHRVDEGFYVSEAGPHHDLTEAQWTVVAGSGHFRFYATATIPTGLYRVNVPSSVLSLNFGILSRLVPLDREGRESFFGLELAAMGVNLAGVSNFPASLALVAGVGISLPLGSHGEVTQSSVDLHAWVMREFRNEACTVSTLSPGMPGCDLASHWAFVFGPSISIGNIGANF